MRISANYKELPNYVGKETGVSSWFTVTQGQIDEFASATHDQQYIHTDPEKAKDSPFGGTIAHGFLSLSLLSAISYEAAIDLEGSVMGLNYGFDKVRFLAPVKVDSCVRGRMSLGAVTEKKPGHFLYEWDVTVEIEGESVPALVARWLTMTIINKEK